MNENKLGLLSMNMLHGYEDSGFCLTLVRQIKEQNWKFLSVIFFCKKKGGGGGSISVSE